MGVFESAALMYLTLGMHPRSLLSALEHGCLVNVDRVWNSATIGSPGKQGPFDSRKSMTMMTMVTL